jgi:hypothetical protein
MVMVDYSLLAAMAAVVVLLLFLRTNTAVAYLALCGGSVLLLSSGDNVGLVASSLTSGMSAAAMIAKMVLLLTPLAVTAVLLKGQVSRGLLLFSLVPALCIAFLSAVLVVPLLDDSLRITVQDTDTWNLLVQYQEMFTGVGLVASIIMIAMTLKHPHKKHKKGRH